MRSKHKRSVAKTRSSKVEAKPYVPLRKHTGPLVHGERNTKDTEEHCQDRQWEGNQDSCAGGEREGQDEHQTAEQIRNQENSEEPVHPGPLQTVSELPEQAAVDQTSDETHIEAEVLQ